MSSKQFNKTIISSTQPANGLVGDEWFNPTTNKLYKFLPLNSQMLRWCEIPQTASANNLTLNNIVSNGTATFTGTTTNLALNTTNLVENVSLSAAAPVGYLDYNVTGQTILYVTGNSTGNFVLNIRGSEVATLNSILQIGQSITCALLLTNGGTAYYVSAIRVDGLAPALTRWQGGTAPSSGNVNSIDTYNFTVIKTANATFTVLASSTKFA